MTSYAERIRSLPAEQRLRLADQLTPLTFAQERIWLLDRLEPGQAVFNLAGAVRLSGRLDVAVLRRALAEVVRRHEILRTTFVTVAERPYQVIAPPSEPALRVRNLTDLRASQRDAAVRDYLTAEASRPFDLEAGPLFRTSLLRLGPELHIFGIVFHHIVADGWSNRVLNREVGELYRAFIAGKASPLSPLEIQYSDFAAWQRQAVETGLLDGELEYWRGRLKGAPHALELPTDRPRPAVQAFRGGTETRTLPAALVERLDALARAQGATLFMVLSAGLAAVLGRHAGTQDVAVGIPIAGRVRPETEPLIGLFINTLVLRVRLDEDPTITELLRHVREVALGAFDHQSLPFECLLEAVQPPRDLSRTPVFQVLLNMQNFEPAPVELPGLVLEPIASGVAPAAKFDLTFYASQDSGAVHLRLVYNAALFTAATTARILDHLHRFLGAAAEDPSRRLSAVRLLHAGDDAPPPARLPAAETTRAEASSLYEAFARVAAERGGTPALVTADATWTYRTLARWAERVAGAVLRASCPPGAPVAVVARDPLLSVAAILGVLRAGHPYVVLDEAAPPARLDTVLADAAPALVLLAGGARPLRPAVAIPPGLRTLHVGELEDASQPPPPVRPHAIAYLLYTSGTTGEPKGVAQTHGNALHFARTYAQSIGIGPGDRLTLLPSLGFDAALMDLFGALLSGASLHPMSLVDEGAAALVRRMDGEAVTVCHSTPTVFRHVAEFVGPENLRSVRRWVLGGEEATAGDLEVFRRVAPRGAVLTNGLGPTECTLALQFSAGPDAEVLRASLPVGDPVAGVDVVLLDAAGRETEIVGELGIRSAYLALGYWGRPGATAAAFRPDPTDPGRRTYHTGDLAWRLPDGSFQYLRRIDEAVKVGGIRVHPGALAAALRELPEVRDCVVRVQADEGSGAILVAYVVPGQGHSVSEGTLRAHLRTRIPRHLMPSRIVPLPELPLNSNGKPDRGALSAADPAPVAEPAHTPEEQMLAELFASLLKRPLVGVHDDFFSLGGNSLLAMRLLVRLQETTGAELPLRAMFDAPTVAGLALQLRAAACGDGAASVPIAAAQTRDIADLLAELDA